MLVSICETDTRKSPPLDWNNSMEYLGNVRFYGLPRIVQPILYLARLFSDRVERTRVTCRIGPRRASELILEAQVVACGPSYLRHTDVWISDRARCYYDGLRRVAKEGAKLSQSSRAGRVDI